MGNIYSIRRGEGGLDLDLTNGATDVFLDVMTLASCPLAHTPWQQNLALLFADSQRFDYGFAGFALDELPWTDNATQEHRFLLAVIDKALTRHGWNLLTYDPPYAQGYLETYRTMVQRFTPVPTISDHFGDWRTEPDADRLQRCAKHDIFQGYAGCRLCDPNLQPVP
ncbi:MAG TPA: hypothetical protein VJR58_23405 [Vineibacter sp.]|nr:hypothetical protein [Vineibacter sp.]